MNLQNFSSNHEASGKTFYAYAQRVISNDTFEFHVLLVWIRLLILSILISFTISFLSSKLKFPNKYGFLNVMHLCFFPETSVFAYRFHAIVYAIVQKNCSNFGVFSSFSYGKASFKLYLIDCLSGKSKFFKGFKKNFFERR